MKATEEHHQRMAKLIFADIYPCYVRKVEKKGRTKTELDQVIAWLTGFGEAAIQACIDEAITFDVFFEKATINPDAHLITGTICGYKIQEIDNLLTKRIRYLDKLVDELAKGRAMEKILRKPKD